MKTEIVFNSILKRAKDKGVELTHLKVQKLLYFLHGYYLAKTGTPLLDEPIQAWQYGPVVHSLYGRLKHYGSDPVTKYLTTTDEVSKQENVYIADSEDFDFWSCMDEVWSKYAHLSGGTLSTLSHKSGSPWDRTPRLRQEITNELIQEYFLKEMDQGNPIQ